MVYGDNGIESAWLIEDMGTDRRGPSLYWTALPYDKEWSFSVDRAIRFSRKSDAEQVIMGLFGLNPDFGSDFPPRMIATDHEWG
jgi:hypothetical protein